MHNVVKPTQLSVSAQQQFKVWIMQISKFVTSFTSLTTNMSRLWRATTAITEKVYERNFLWSYRSIQAQQFTYFSDRDHFCSRLGSVQFNKCYTWALSMQTSHFLLYGFTSNSTFNNCVFELKKKFLPTLHPLTWLPRHSIDHFEHS